MIYRVLLFLALCAWGSDGVARIPAGGGSVATPYTGPCDIVVCVEAWSMTRSMKTSYTGPLFSIQKNAAPYTSCDIQQNANRKADMATPCIATACTGGVITGCFIDVVYAHIQGSANNLRQYDYGQSLKVTVDVTTGLPVFDNTAGPGTPAMRLITSNPGAADIHADQVVAGAPADGASRSVMVVGRAVPFISQCCGFFGWSHKSDLPSSIFWGTDFMPIVTYNHPDCGSNNYCAGLDLEQGGGCVPTTPPPGPSLNLGPTVTDQMFIATFNASSTVISFSSNNNQSSATNPTTGCSPHGYARLAAGGDMSLTPTYFREGLLTAGVLSGTEQTALFNNVTAAYPALTFP